MGYSGIIIEGKNKKFLFQLRDNKKGISNPNKWGLFGGGIESNESPVKAIIREIKEELNLELIEKNIKFLFKNGKNNIFYYKLEEDRRDFILNEGQNFKFFKIREILFKKKVVFRLRIFLIFYPLIKLRIFKIITKSNQ